SIAISVAAEIQKEGLMAGATTAQIAQLAAAQSAMAGTTTYVTDATRAMTLEQMKAIEMNEALAASNVAVAESSKSAASAMGLNGMQASMLRLRMGSMLGSMLGVNGAMVGLAGVFGSMAIGSIAVIGIMAALSGMIYLYEKMSLSIRGVTADEAKLIDAFDKAQKMKEAGGKTQATTTALQKD